MRFSLLTILLGTFGGILLTVHLFTQVLSSTSQLFILIFFLMQLLIAWWCSAKLFSLPWRAPTLIILFLTIGTLALLVFSVPSGQVSPESPLTSVYRGPQRFSKLSPAWLLDEGDQIRMGGELLPYLDPRMSIKQGRQFRETFAGIYREMSRSSDFNKIGSALDEAYQDLFLNTPPIGHMYVYRPKMTKGQRYPVLVFLHGFLGNMKAYVWAWSKFAEQNEFIVLFPSFGNGLWQGKIAEDMLHWIDQFIHEDGECDSSRIYVAGLSNGGTGVTKWAQTLPQSYLGLIYISPVMTGTDQVDFSQAIGKRPVLVVHGGNDNRIPPDYVQEHSIKMTKHGLNVSRIVYDTEDHILVLSSQKRLQEDILKWMKEQSF